MATALAVHRTVSCDPKNPLRRMRVNVQHTERQIRHWCALFVFIDRSKLYLIHQTAKEFLICTESGSDVQRTARWGGSFPMDECDNEMARLSVEYLSMNSIRSSSRPGVSQYPILGIPSSHGNPDAEEHSNGVFDFYAYCSQHWAKHLRDNYAVQNHALLDKAVTLCDTSRRDSCGVWYEYFPLDMYTNEDHELDRDHLLAAHTGNLAVLERLHQLQNFDIDVVGSCGCTALHIAIRYKHEDVAQWLLQKKARFNIRAHGLELLFLAVRMRAYRIARALLDTGADANCVDGWGESVLAAAFSHAKPAIALLLLRRGAGGGDQYTAAGENALHIAASMGWTSVVEKLVEHGAKVDSKDESGETGAHKAVFRGHAPTLDTLLYLGANVNAHAHPPDGDTPLILAASMEAPSCATVLMDWGADVNATNDVGQTALHAAIESESWETARLIRDAGGQANFEELWASDEDPEEQESDVSDHASGENGEDGDGYDVMG